MPSVLEVTVSNDGIEVVYNASAVDAIGSSLSHSPGDTTSSSAGNRTSTSTNTPTVAPRPEPDRATQAETLIHEYVNEQRRNSGLDPLEQNDDLARVAHYHSADMAEEDYFAHTSPDGESLEDRYNRFGIGCAGGENIFKLTASFGVSPDSVARQAVDSWMGSPGHRENILRSRFTDEGIGVVYDGSTVYVTQNFC